MDDFQKRVIEKLDRIDDRLNDVDKTLVEQHMSLKEHMRRTDLLEMTMAPIQKKAEMAEGALKLIAFLSAIAIGIVKLFGH